MWWQRQREKLTFKRDSPLLWKNTREKALRFDWAVRERLKDQTHEDDKHRERDTHTEYILRYWKWDAPRERHFKESRTLRHWPSGVEFSLRRAELEGFNRLLGLGCRSGDFTMADMRICWRAAGTDGGTCSWALKWAADRERERQRLSTTQSHQIS